VPTSSKRWKGFYDRAEEAAKSGRDSAASSYLEPGNRWNPMIDAISTYVNGCELDRVSILDMDAYKGHRDQLAGAARLRRADDGPMRADPARAQLRRHAGRSFRKRVQWRRHRVR